MIQFTHSGIDVHSETIRIPTYLEGPKDPNPPLFGKGVRAIYPYPWQKSFANEIEEKNYDAIVIESKWIKAVMLPDWGMHLYRAIDRVSGRDMFHCPKVMKPAYNAIRGAYVAGGVEFNFPVGHTAMTWSRCRLRIKKTAEGVQALFIHIDKRSGMRIAAGLTLRPDYHGIVFEQYLHNPTPLPQAWYYWLNAGLAPHRSMRFLFPAAEMLGHFEGPFMETIARYPYPMRNGTDYSKYDSIPEPIGLFSATHQSGWFGAWYEDWDFGIIRWAPPWQAAGQKLWSWGNSEEGALWGKIAADQELPVPEIQSGRPEIQMDRGILPPFGRLAHRECWLPVSGIGNVNAAGQCGAMALQPAERGGGLRIFPAAAMKRCRIKVDGQILGKPFDLEVGKSVHIKLPTAPASSVSVVDKDGARITWSNAKCPAAINVDSLYSSFVSAKDMSAERFYLKGFKYERTLRPDLAMKYYRQALKIDPSCSKAHLRLGALEMESGNLDGALGNFKKTLDIDRWNDEALYLHGLASLWKEDMPQARADLLRVAATGREYVLPALILLTKDAFLRQELHEFDGLLACALEIDPKNPTLLFLSALAARKRGKLKKCGEYCESLDKQTGASMTASFERRFASIANDAIDICAGAETEDDLSIDAALKYVECGCVKEAVDILGQCKSLMGRLQAKYLRRWLGADSEDSCEGRFFAWGREMAQALASSLSSDSSDPAALFALGCLEAERGNFQAAIGNLRLASTLKPDDPVIMTALGATHLEAGNIAGAVSILENAVALSPPNPRAWVLLDKALAKSEGRDDKWLARYLCAPESVLDNEEARESLAALCVVRGHFDKAIGLLTGRIFHPYELTHNLRNIWAEAHRAKAVREAMAGALAAACETAAKAIEYPENLALGKPLRTFDARNLYTAARISELAKEREAAENYFEKAAQEDQPGPTVAKPWSVLAQIRLGHGDLAKSRLKELIDECEAFIEADFQPDLADTVNDILDTCRKIERGWVPSMEELSAVSALNI